MNRGGESKTLLQIAEFERKQGREKVVFSLEEYVPNDGSEPAQYGKAQVHYRDQQSGEWRFTGKIITFRKAEIPRWRQGLEQLERLLSGKEKPGETRPPREHRIRHGAQQTIAGTRRPNEQDLAGPGPSEAELAQDEAIF